MNTNNIDVFKEKSIKRYYSPEKYDVPSFISKFILKNIIIKAR